MSWFGHDAARAWDSQCPLWCPPGAEPLPVFAHHTYSELPNLPLSSSPHGENNPVDLKLIQGTVTKFLTPGSFRKNANVEMYPVLLDQLPFADSRVGKGISLTSLALQRLRRKNKYVLQSIIQRGLKMPGHQGAFGQWLRGAPPAGRNVWVPVTLGGSVKFYPAVCCSFIM